MHQLRHTQPLVLPPLLGRPPCPACGAQSLRPDIVWFGECPYRMGEIYAALRGRTCSCRSAPRARSIPPLASCAMRASWASERLSSISNRARDPSCFTKSRLGPASELLVPAWVGDDAGRLGTSLTGRDPNAIAICAWSLQRPEDQPLEHVQFAPLDRPARSCLSKDRTDRVHRGEKRRSCPHCPPARPDRRTNRQSLGIEGIAHEAAIAAVPLAVPGKICHLPLKTPDRRAGERHRPARRHPKPPDESRSCHFHRAQGSRPEGPAPRYPRTLPTCAGPSGRIEPLYPPRGATSAFRFARYRSVKIVWRCRLLASTTSSSTSVSAPIPAPGYCSAGEPIPPQPISTTCARASLPSPPRPLPGGTMWRAKRSGDRATDSSSPHGAGSPQGECPQSQNQAVTRRRRLFKLG